MKTSYHERDYTFGQAMLTLRNKIGLTQERLGSVLGVSERAVAGWEGGSNYPKAKHLKALIELAVQRQAFSKDTAAEEIRRLWKVAHQKVLLDEDWLGVLLAGQTSPQGPDVVEEKSMTVGTCENGQGQVAVPTRVDGQGQAAVPTRVDGQGQVAVPARVDGQGQAAVPTTMQNLPFPPNPFFTGRQSLLRHLERLFECNERIAITQPVSISGLGGIGKTQLALEYAHRCYPHIYRCVLWVNAADKAALEASYLALARLLELVPKQEREVERIVRAVNVWLEQHGSWLLILDNADDLELASRFLPKQPRGHILLTTRTQIVGHIAVLLPVDAMSREEGLLFLLRRSGVLKSGTALERIEGSQRQEAERLVELLSGHPLALDQAGAYIEETADPLVSGTGTAFREYRQLYQQESRALLKSRGTLGSQHPQSVARTFEISLQKACQLHPNCADILSLCALLHPDAISEELLCQEMGLDRLHFNETIRALRRHSLVKRDAEKKMLSVHRLVQAVIRESMESQTLREWTERVVRALNNAFPEGGFEEWSRCEQLLPHALICATWLEREVVAPAEAGHLLHKAGNYLRERGLYTDAQSLHKLALAIREQHLGASHADTARSLHHLALLYRLQGKYELAEPLSLRALALLEQLLGASHPDTADSLNNLATLYRDQGKYELAEPLYLRALAIKEQLLGASHPDTANSLNNLAVLYWQQGKYELAEPLYERALAIREQHLGTDHPDTAVSLNNLALLYWQQGKYERALPLYERALAIREQHLGASHPNTATSLHNLATLYQDQGKYELAEPLYERALAIREQHLGASHPNTASSLNNLANLYQHQGKYELAESLHLRALAIREQHLGADHPDTAYSLNSLANLYWRQGKYELAEPLYERALAIREKHLGASHPDTATSLHNLANFYQDQGKYELAEPLYERALAIKEQHLGASHPDTADSLNNLATLYRDQGKYERALPLYLRALAIYEQRLEASHPNTAEALQGLAELYQRQGKYEQAEILYQRVLSMREQRLGEAHPDTQASRKAYAEFLFMREQQAGRTYIPR
jgi:tetratricopeptide (TPR) repeat protein